MKELFDSLGEHLNPNTSSIRSAKPPLFVNKEASTRAYFPTGHIIEHRLGSIVYLKTDLEQNARMVTAISLRPNYSVCYCLALGTDESWHYGIEIDSERDIVKATSG